LWIIDVNHVALTSQIFSASFKGYETSTNQISSWYQ